MCNLLKNKIVKIQQNASKLTVLFGVISGFLPIVGGRGARLFFLEGRVGGRAGGCLGEATGSS